MTKFTRRTAIGLMASAALPLPFIRRVSAQDRVLNLYNWADYVSAEVIDGFTEATGISVNYDIFSSIEESEAKLLTGSTGYDLVLIGGPSMPLMTGAGVLQPLDRAKLPSWGNLDPEILELAAKWDEGNRFGFVYTWGTTGLAFNAAMVLERVPEANLSSLDLVFDPAVAGKLADCGITLLDSPTDIFRLALSYLGRDPDDLSEGNIAAVVDLLAPVRPGFRNFDNTSVANGLASAEICVATTWSGEFATAQARAVEAGTGAELTYVFPETGSPVWVDNFGIPADAPHADNAHAFIEHLLQPEVIATTTNSTAYANANAASQPFIAPEILANPAIFPDAESRKRLWAPKAPTETELKAMTRAWQKIKNS